MQYISARVLKATRSSVGSEGIITFEIEVPLFIWTEILTHRNFARNASSARAMSTKRYTDMSYYVPSVFYTQGTGMQSSREPTKHQWIAKGIYHGMFWLSKQAAYLLEKLNVSKEQRNRVIPPYKMIRGIVTGTEQAWNDFLELRNSLYADSAMQIFAMHVQYSIDHVNWQYSTFHNPYDKLLIVDSIATIARVSYNRDKGKDNQKLFNSLLEQKHLSVFEHLARFVENPHPSVLSKAGWQTYRSEIEHGDLKTFRQYFGDV